MSRYDQYRTVLASSPVPMLLVNMDGKVCISNDASDALFEYDSGGLVGRSVDTLVPESARENHANLRKSYHNAPTKRPMGAGRELGGITRSGATIPLELGLQPIELENEHFALIAAVDIRHRKDQDNRMRLAMNAALSAMVMVDKNGNIVFLNKAASNLFGFPSADLLGKPIDVLIPEKTRARHPEYVRGFVKNRKTRSMAQGIQLFARHRSGKQIPVEIGLTPIDSSEEYVLCTVFDLTERVAAKAQNKELAALTTELARFERSASHDLKAPMSSISGLLKICLEDIDDGDLVEAKRIIQRAIDISEQGAQKIESMLQIAGSDQEICEPTEFALKPMIEDVWKGLAGSSGDRLVLDLEHQDPIVTECETLKTILKNLLSNALQFRDLKKNESVVHIRTSSDAETLTVEISDNGVGISSKDQQRVFQMFTRLDERSGDGLGLSLVRKLLDRLEGSIKLVSDHGNGTTFAFTLRCEWRDNG